MDSLNDIEEQGLIKAFEYTYELSWKVLQDLLKERCYMMKTKSVLTITNNKNHLRQSA